MNFVISLLIYNIHCVIKSYTLGPIPLPTPPQPCIYRWCYTYVVTCVYVKKHLRAHT